MRNERSALAPFSIGLSLFSLQSHFLNRMDCNSTIQGLRNGTDDLSTFTDEIRQLGADYRGLIVGHSL